MSLNLFLVSDVKRASLPGWVSSRYIGLVGALVLVIVVIGTRGEHVTPSFYGVSDLMEEQVDKDVLKQIRGGDRICIVGDRRLAFLYASEFHRPLEYYVTARKAVEECGGDKVMVLAKGW